MARFRRTVDALELRDIHLHGRTYTWSNERSDPTLVKLDRVLTTVDWEETHPHCLKALSSDHCPLMLQTNASFRSKPRFHFEIFWPKFDDFLEVVTRGWFCDENVINAFRRLDCLIRSVKDRSRRPEGGEWEPIKISSEIQTVSLYLEKHPSPQAF